MLIGIAVAVKIAGLEFQLPPALREFSPPFFSPLMLA
jgi:hypothetical protein